MTDAAIPVTQSVVEGFTEQYLESLGGTIEKHGHTWNVSIPEGAATDLPSGDLVLVCDDVEEVTEGEKALHPESTFFHEVLNEASSRAPVGHVTIDARSSEIVTPEWLQEGKVVVNDAQFVPYYDRTAIVVLFRVSIETVSEYQHEFLHAIALDTRSEEVLPNLDETFLELTKPGCTALESEDVAVDPDQVERLIDLAQDHVVSEVRPKIDEIHQEASRAADAELEDYRQMQQQREEELEKQLSSLQSRIKELSNRIDRCDENERVQALKERKEYRSEYEELESELLDLRQRREQGYPEQQREIRERHALEVVVTPLTITEVEYERGEIEFKLEGKNSTETVTTGYGSGVGVTEEVHCTSCDRVFSEQTPLDTIGRGLHCRKCS